MSIKDYNNLFELQEGRCAICDRHQTELSKVLSVDHDHITGKIRGLLCSRCNTGIGMFDDNIEILNNAINYLDK